MPSPIPANENDRLAELRRLRILDTLPQQAFDSLTTLAAGICGTPIALISLVDENRQWFKARHGVEVAQTSRDESFCAHAILDPHDVLVVQDTTRDVRFQNLRHGAQRRTGVLRGRAHRLGQRRSPGHGVRAGHRAARAGRPADRHAQAPGRSGHAAHRTRAQPPRAVRAAWSSRSSRASRSFAMCSTKAATWPPSSTASTATCS